MSAAPVLVIVSYQARAGCEEQLAGLLRTHFARLQELGLVAELPHFAAERAEEPGRFVESFSWLNAGARAQAQDNSEVQEIWMRLEDLCAADGIRSIELKPL